MKKAVLTLDVEDWFHLDYFAGGECDRTRSNLDGLLAFVDVLDKYEIKASFFVLGEVAEAKIDFLSALVEQGHDVGSHGWSHAKPLTQPLPELNLELKRCFQLMEQINGHSEFGYRAPCFNLDRQRLDLVRSVGFAYDSSRIDFDWHPLYGSINLDGFSRVMPDVYQRGDFFEFEVTTSKILGRPLPISGGGYLRIFPWVITKSLLKRHLATGNLYSLYLHPFELSEHIITPPKGTPWLTKFRCEYGVTHVKDKLEALIHLIRGSGYEFTTYKKIREDCIQQS